MMKVATKVTHRTAEKILHYTTRKRLLVAQLKHLIVSSVGRLLNAYLTVLPPLKDARQEELKNLPAAKIQEQYRPHQASMKRVRK
jgi:hypothetical protein